MIKLAHLPEMMPDVPQKNGGRIDADVLTERERRRLMLLTPMIELTLGIEAERANAAAFEEYRRRSRVLPYFATDGGGRCYLIDEATGEPVPGLIAFMDLGGWARSLVRRRRAADRDRSRREVLIMGDADIAKRVVKLAHEKFGEFFHKLSFEQQLELRTLAEREARKEGRREPRETREFKAFREASGGKINFGGIAGGLRGEHTEKK